MEHFLDPLIQQLGIWPLLGIVAASILVLGTAADRLVDQAVVLSIRSGLPRIIIGATIVSLGTTMPEATVSVLAARKGEPGMALGNAVGSVICDTGLILGIACLMSPLPLDRDLVNRQGWAQFGAGLLLVMACLPWANLSGILTQKDFRLEIDGASNNSPITVTTSSGHDLANGTKITIEGVDGNTAANGNFLVRNRTTNTFDLYDFEGASVKGNGSYPTSGGGFIYPYNGARLYQWVGWLFLLLLAVYMTWSVRLAKRSSRTSAPVEEEDETKGEVRGSIWLAILKLLAATVFLVAASTVLISATRELAIEHFNVPVTIVAATLVAFGTSLPELVTAITAVRKKQGELAVGNVIGADILNVLFVSGAAAAVTTEGLRVDFPTLRIQFPIMLLVLGFFRMGIFSAKSGKLSRPFGALLLAAYLIYLGITIGAGRYS